MDHYLTDDERVESIKRWWSSNGSSVIVGIVMGVAVIIGWQYWTSYQATQGEEASLAYELVVSALQEGDIERVESQGAKILDEYSSTPYATLAALSLAKVAVDKDDYDTAVGHLEWVVANSNQAAIEGVARLRLARVMLAMGRLDDAQAELAKVTDASFAAEREELKGDIHVAANEPDEARAAYEAARAARGFAAPNEWLQMKLDNLQPANGSAEAAS